MPVPSASAAQPVVYAVLFYSPGCGHCHLVITEALPPLFEKHADQLVIVGVDVSQVEGQALFMAVLQHFNLESGGVPFLVVGDTYLVGSIDIPQKFPALIEQYLDQGGVDWPRIPVLAEAMRSAQQAEATPAVEATSTLAATAVPASATPAVPSSTSTPGLFMTVDDKGLKATFSRDLQGNTLAVIVLAAMLLSVGGAPYYFRRSPAAHAASASPARRDWLVPILCLLGLVVAGYLAYVETTHVEAICGPVGDCNTVQHSAYARLFGVLPVGVLGLAGYGMLLLAWFLGRSSDRRLAACTQLALLGMTAFGLLFSIYLTFLEPFVIGATCAWCLTSAVIMTALFWLSLASSRAAITSLLVPNKKKLIHKT